MRLEPNVSLQPQPGGCCQTCKCCLCGAASEVACVEIHDLQSPDENRPWVLLNGKHLLNIVCGGRIGGNCTQFSGWLCRWELNLEPPVADITKVLLLIECAGNVKSNILSVSLQMRDANNNLILRFGGGFGPTYIAGRECFDGWMLPTFFGNEIVTVWSECPE